MKLTEASLRNPAAVAVAVICATGVLRRWALIAAMLASSDALFARATIAADPVDVWTLIDPKRVCFVSATWRIGIGAATTFDTIETVSAIEAGGVPVWRITHHMQRTVENRRADAIPALDVYDLDRRTLHPIQSELRRASENGAPQPVTRFAYDIAAGTARRLDQAGAELEATPLMGRIPLPEGPGSAAIYQAISWRDGLRFRAHTVNRYRGSGAERLTAVDFTVIGRKAVTIGGRAMETYVVSEIPSDGSSRVTTNYVTVTRPHRLVRVESASGARPPFISEAVALAQDRGCSD